MTYGVNCRDTIFNFQFCPLAVYARGVRAIGKHTCVYVKMKMLYF